MHDPQYSYSPTGSSADILFEEATRAFMRQVYLWMSVGLAITGGVAWTVASSQQLMMMVLPWFKVLLVAELGLVFAFSFLQSRVSTAVAGAMYLAYVFLTGLTFSVLFLVYELGSISSAFVITAGTFGALSAYGAMTKKDLSGWGTFLMMGLIGIIIAGIVNIFIQSDMLGFVKSCAGVLIFAGLTAYDTQKLRQLHLHSRGRDRAGLAIAGALMLYLDFVNLFLNLLRLLGRRR